MWPFVARAQQPVIGFLGATSDASIGGQVSAFRRGLNETGFVEGRNVTIEYRWAEGQANGCRLWWLKLVARSVSLIVAQSPPAALAAKAATANIPIVFVVGFDPVVWSGHGPK